MFKNYAKGGCLIFLGFLAKEFFKCQNLKILSVTVLIPKIRVEECFQSKTNLLAYHIN